MFKILNNQLPTIKFFISKLEINKLFKRTFSLSLNNINNSRSYYNNTFNIFPKNEIIDIEKAYNPKKGTELDHNIKIEEIELKGRNSKYPKRVSICHIYYINIYLFFNN
jgi:hypothetical protein